MQVSLPTLEPLRGMVSKQDYEVEMEWVRSNIAFLRSEWERLMDSEHIGVGDPIPRIRFAEALEDRRVRITWENGRSQTVDLTPALTSHRAFVRLRNDDDLFRALRVSEYRDCLEWPDGSELPATWIEELADTPLNNAEFRDAMDKLQMSLDGMASRLGIARRLVADYRKDKPIPKTVALATRYLLDQRKFG